MRTGQEHAYHSLPEEHEDYGERHCCKKTLSRSIASSIFHCTLLPLSLFLFLLLVACLIIIFATSSSDRTCSQKTSVYSPLLNEIEYVNVDFQNGFTEPSIYRGPPTPRLEDDWKDLIFSESPIHEVPLLTRDKEHAVRIPQSKLFSLNRDPIKDRLELLPPTSDSKEPEYSALIDVFHQLHCLNRLRQYTWYLSGHYVPDSLTEPSHPEYHLNNTLVLSVFLSAGSS